VEIVRLAHQLGADLIVMGAHGTTERHPTLLGSVAEHVVRDAPCAVLTVPAPRQPQAVTAERQTRFRTILVPLDGSEVAASILAQVVALARSHEARLLLLTVGLPMPTWLTRARDLQYTLTFQAEAYLGRVRAYLEAQGLEVNTLVCIGEPASAILEVAAQQQVDLIVINSRGGGGSPLPFLGSVAKKMASAAAVPVLVLHTPADKKGPQTP
jgi:nucleotide-binding universal stress UspA family protein